MAKLTEQVATDLMTAMKTKDETKLVALRMLKAEFQKLQAEKGKSAEITDADAQAVIRRLIKQRVDAAEQYAAGGAMDRAEAERAEIKYLEPYLPAQMTDAELAKLIEDVAQETGAAGPRDMGKLMKATMAKVAGRADGKKVKEQVTAFLNK